jgi:hypothetical protein
MVGTVVLLFVGVFGGILAGICGEKFTWGKWV